LIFCITLSSISHKNVFFFDEIDRNLDIYYESLCSKLVKKQSSKGLQFFIITHKEKTTVSGDKWYGVSVSKKGGLVENISFQDSKRFLSIKF